MKKEKKTHAFGFELPRLVVEEPFFIQFRDKHQIGRAHV